MDVVDNTTSSRYELWAANQLLGFADYQRHGNLVTIPHTEIKPEHEGKGYGSILIHGALEKLTSAGDRLVPSCPFVAHYIRKHPEYEYLVPS